MWLNAQISFVEKPAENRQGGPLRGGRWPVYASRSGWHPLLDFPLSHRRQIIPPWLGQLPIFVPARSAPTRHRLPASAAIRLGPNRGEAQDAAAGGRIYALVYDLQGGRVAFHHRARSFLAQR